MAVASSPFRSFWMGGFECSTHIGRRRVRLDLLRATEHDLQAERDYALARSQGLLTVRDGVRWHLIEQHAEQHGHYDFASLGPMVEAAERQGVQVIWDLCHYGWPDGLDLFAPEFVERFARFCGATARFIRERSDAPPLYTPVNEISFFAWAAGQVGYFHPFAKGRGAALKRQLVRAAIAGAEAIWAVDARARMLSAEPLIHVVPPKGKPQYRAAATRKRASQFEAWDMLSGRAAPELGGSARHLDVLGVNFYHDNQWQHPGAKRLGWDEAPLDERWVPLRKLLGEVWERYGRPLYIAETSHFGSGRAAWLRHVTTEVAAAQAAGVPVLGVCLYPILDRPDWDKPRTWHHSGLWDLRPGSAGASGAGSSRAAVRLERVLNEPYAAELRRAREGLPETRALALAGNDD